ncbi:MAG: hypothetical protein GOMPHAMPRED_000815 [Gomphillus americanus]|uniref:Protein HGH1 homolog n=1 Tax=Gomphillus americanus TaxID=1940652 RepID=A0A8H3EZV0_9LECA|nr:MAG: hypothetical protein GOMPHAMPRED_000815 [Gomphillus americanus]
MPTELEELVEFLHHGNTQIRQIAAENCLAYSKNDPSLFKRNNLEPVHDLKLLVKDYGPIAKNALDMLINLSNDKQVLESLDKDDKFLETLLFRITNTKEPNANEIAMLLSNMAKSDSFERLFTLERDAPLGLSRSRTAINQLMDCFVKGAEGAYNSEADFDYLAYLFADLSKFAKGATYMTTIQPYDEVPPISKLLPFTTHASHIRRLGVASTLKNISFTLPIHPTLLFPPLSALPFVLLPLTSGEDSYSDKETESLPDELQLLDPSIKREQDDTIITAHLETLLLWTTNREGRDFLRKHGAYYVVRECHLAVDNEDVRAGCDRLVQILMRDEEAEEPNVNKQPSGMDLLSGLASEGRMVTTEPIKKPVEESDDEDDKIIEIL